MTTFLIMVTELILLLNIMVLYRRINKLVMRIDAQSGAAKALNDTFRDTYGKVQMRLEELEKGVVPDYEAAKEAAKAVNDFNAGISGILGFDPKEALRKQNMN